MFDTTPFDGRRAIRFPCGTLACMSDPECWPPLPLNEWRDTYRTLHMWTQIAGKIRMALFPPINHWWNVTLYVSARGLTTGPVPYPPGIFEIEFDFQKHELNISTSWGAGASRPLRAESVASFYAGLTESLARLGIEVAISPRPQEVADPVPFDRDSEDNSYDAQYASRFWRILVSSFQSLRAVPREVRRQVQPGALFLGQLRSGVQPFLRAARAGPPRKYQRPGIFTRSIERRLLARRRRHRGSRLLLLHGSPARGTRKGTDTAGGGGLERTALGIHPDV